jgi:hypothetical protein
MKKFFLFLTLFCQISISIYAQESAYVLPNTRVFKFLREERFSGVNLKINTGHLFNLVPLSGTKFEKYTQNFFLTHGEIIVYIGATGIVYKSEGDFYGDSITFKRIDATQHHGYNINGFPFFYKDNLYNIGGYGFWHWNGQLRIFSERSKEWNILPLNKEYPIAIDPPGSYLWLSKENGTLYSFSFIEGNEAIKAQNKSSITKIDSVLELDISTASWRSLGVLNESLKNMITIKSVFASIDSGILITKDANQLLILNLTANRIDTLSNSDIYHFFATSSDTEIYFYSNNYFYKVLSQKNIIDSIKLTNNNIKIGKQNVYQTSNLVTSNKELTYTLFFALFGIIIYLLIKRYLPSSSNSIHNKVELKSPYKNDQIFDEIEKSLILYIYKKAKETGIRTTTEEVNRIIGVANKSIDMQKRKRSDIIKSINSKYQSSTNNNQLLIDRVKSEHDARLQEYYLTIDTLDFLNDINSQNQE